MEKESAVLCVKSELDLFTSTPIQMAVDSSSFVEIHPISTLTDKTPIEFYISGDGEHYLDPAHTILHLRIQIQKKNSTSLVDADEVAPINYILNTLFSECSVFLNDKQIASQANYPYRAVIESLLLNSKSVQESLLSSSLFFKDSAGQHDVVTGATNAGFAKRKEICANSKVIDLIGALHFDLASQSKFLISGVGMKIKLERNKDDFALMAGTANYKIHLQAASLYVRKINVSPSVLLAQEKALERGVIKMPIRRVEVKTFAISSGLQSTTIPNCFLGPLPARIIIGLVSNQAFNGNINKNPFNFAHYDLNYLSIQNGNQTLPAKPYQPNFEKNIYARSLLLSLFTDLNRYHTSSNININFSEYKEGYTLYAFDLTPDLASGESHVSINKSGNIAIDIKFAKALPETISLIVYSEFRNVLEIDRSRGVFTDY